MPVGSATLAGRKCHWWDPTAVPAPLAQLAEHVTLNHRVVGSSPTGGTQKALRSNELRKAFLMA